MYFSPLRYPGGKALMTSFLVNLFNTNGLKDILYAEPYAGGAGAAINLLMSNSVSKILINDANIGVYSFWHSLINEPEHFIQIIDSLPITITEWHKQKDILKHADKPSFDLGVATFFLSRTNRSGVISGGAIGGATEEKQKTAKYKIDCRFNKKTLIPRLRAIANNRNRIIVSNLDALAFLRHLDNDVFVYLDPPYFAKGKYLYMNHYSYNDHKDLAEFLIKKASFKWLLSYDDTPQIRDLYASLDLFRFPLNYTVETKRTGYELLAHSSNLIFPKVPQIHRHRGKDIDIEYISQR